MEVCKEVQMIHAPLEVIEHGRNIRDPSQMGHFKASEYFNYLLFVSPIIFRERLSDSLYHQLLFLVFGIRILMQSSAEEDIVVAESLLEKFCSGVKDVFQSETAETINVHCLKHLSYQCRSYGPLFVFSAMAFESANRTLNQCFSGTHSHCSVICRRYIEAQELTSAVFEDDRAAELLQQWWKTGKSSEKNFSRDVLPLAQIENCLEIHPGAQILSRSFVDGVYFDSVCYRRCPAGPNSFIRAEIGSDIIFGQIVFFIIMGDDSYTSGWKFAQIKKMAAKGVVTILDCPRSQFFFEVEFTGEEDMIEATSFEKMFFMTSRNKLYLASVPPFLDHK